MPRKGQKGRYNYGRKFYLMPHGEVQYRYLNKNKKTKTLVSAKTKKPIDQSKHFGSHGRYK